VNHWRNGATGLVLAVLVALALWNVALRRELRRLRDESATVAPAPAPGEIRQAVRLQWSGEARTETPPGNSDLDSESLPVRTTPSVPTKAVPDPSRHDFETALIQMALQNNVQNRMAMLREFGLTLTLDDVLKSTEGYQTSWMLSLVMKQSDSLDAAALKAWAAARPAGDERRRAIVAVVQALAREKGAAEDLLQWLASLPDADPKGDYSAAWLTALRQLSGENPQEAARWLDVVGSDWNYASHLASTIAQARIREEGPQNAADWANSLKSGPVRDAACSQLATQLADHSPEAALAWAMAIESESARQNVLGQVVTRWAAQDFETAAEWVVAMEAGAVRDHAVRGIVQSLAHQDPASAALWVDLIETRGHKRAALARIIPHWANRDAEQAGAWVSEMPAGLVKDTALHHMALSMLRRDRDAARRWAESIGNSQMREQAVAIVNRNR
jgi:hypothetical protein